MPLSEHGGPLHLAIPLLGHKSADWVLESSWASVEEEEEPVTNKLECWHNQKVMQSSFSFPR
jgi:hypothetical protein